MLLTDDQRSWLVTDAALAATATLDTVERWATVSNGMIHVSNSSVMWTADSQDNMLTATINGRPMRAEVAWNK